MLKRSRVGQRRILERAILLLFRRDASAENHIAYRWSGIVPARHSCGYCPWQRLSLRPLPQGHCSLRPSLRSSSERIDTNARMPRV